MPDQATSLAIVARGSHKKTGQWTLDKVRLRPPGDQELLIRVVASGICHSDVVIGDHAEAIGGYPKVLGHEGAGYVEAVGKQVTVAKTGDPVILSVAYCGRCVQCTTGNTPYCLATMASNVQGSKVFVPELEESPEPTIWGSFLGQSSFASMTVVNETCVTNLKGLVDSDDDLITLAPFGCGIMTGFGTVEFHAKAKPTDSIAIIGTGGVGMSAIMAAKFCGCETVIAIDRVQHRLDLARELGATHTINTQNMTPGQADGLAAKVRELTGGNGTSITINTTSLPWLFQEGIDLTRPVGHYIQIGVGQHDLQVGVQLTPLVVSGKSITGVALRGVVPPKYLPRMVEWHRQGKIPLEKFSKRFRAEDFAQALKEMDDGTTVKPILVW